MSQQAIPAPFLSNPQYVLIPPLQNNGLGIAGFFIALVGLAVPTGIVALLGLLVSLVALGRAPRGFASMGVLLGLFGTVVWLAITGVVILGAVAFGVGALVVTIAGFILVHPEVIEVTVDMANVSIAAIEYEDEHGALPADLEALRLRASTLTDPWRNPYLYTIVPDDPGFDVVSAGPDGVMGNDDDMALSGMERIWEEAIETFGDRMDELGGQLERLQGRSVRFHRTAQHRWNGQTDAAAHWLCQSLGILPRD